MTTVSRAEAAKLFAGLPLPSTADEHWRFTDLRGFDFEQVAGTKVTGTVVAPMLDLDVAGRAAASESGIEIVSAPEGVTFEPLPLDYAARLIPEDDRFALENLAQWIWRRLDNQLPGLERITVRRGFAGNSEGCTYRGRPN